MDYFQIKTNLKYKVTTLCAENRYRSMHKTDIFMDYNTEE